MLVGLTDSPAFGRRNSCPFEFERPEGDMQTKARARSPLGDSLKHGVRMPWRDQGGRARGNSLGDAVRSVIKDPRPFEFELPCYLICGRAPGAYRYYRRLAGWRLGRLCECRGKACMRLADPHSSGGIIIVSRPVGSFAFDAARALLRRAAALACDLDIAFGTAK